MVASWDSFRRQFAGSDNESVGVLEKESVVQLGRRVHDMAKYIAGELTPEVGDEYATMVHGDYKAMVS